MVITYYLFILKITLYQNHYNLFPNITNLVNLKNNGNVKIELRDSIQCIQQLYYADCGLFVFPTTDC